MAQISTDGRTLERCRYCNGRGMIGSGLDVTDPQEQTSDDCPRCGGTGSVERERGRKQPGRFPR